MKATRLALPLAILAMAGCAARHSPCDPTRAAEARAVEFLGRQVPAWSRENRCFSCHNNGDAARALYVASAKGHRVAAGSLADTTAWLARPDQWDENKGDPGFSDKRLANLQFASALVTAHETGHVPTNGPLDRAVRKLLADQNSDGSWPIEPQNASGSPATYGTTLATFLALRTLEHAKSSAATEAMRHARGWLERVTPANMPSAAALLMMAAQSSEPRGTNIPVHNRQFNDAFRLIRDGQTHDGGWGPYADAPPEVFDTALVLLALNQWHSQPGVKEMIEKGRRYLVKQQNPDGSWPATTRPPGGESYAQRLSTTGWATLALLATRD